MRIPPGARRRRLPLLLGGALVIALLVFATRWLLASASEFSIYDDEGFVIVMLRSYLAGRVLYSGFYAQYGPFAYQALAALHHVLGLAPSNDSVRLTSLIIYSATFIVWTGIAVRLMRTPWVIVVFALGLSQHLMAGTVEPGHPQDLAALLVAVCAAAALRQHTAATRRGARAAAACGGAAVAALALTKLNVGVFVAAAVAYAAAAGGRWRRARLALPVLPVLLMSGRLGDAWVLAFCTIETIGLLLLVYGAGDVGPDGRREADGPAAPATAAWVGGGLAATAALVGIEVAHGATAWGLADGIIFQHLGFAARATQPAFMPPGALAAAALSAAAFALLHRNRQRGWHAPVRDACRLVAAAAGLVYAIGFGADYLLAFIPPFVWLLAAPPPPIDRRAMAFLAALALLLPLQGYPIAGTQAYLGTIPLTLLCALTFDDVVTAHGTPTIRAAVALLALLGLGYELNAARQLILHYDELTPLALPGAALVRLPPVKVEEYRQLTEYMKAFDAFVSEPGLLSLYGWTGRVPPTPWNAGAWMALLRTDQQEQIVAALRHAGHPGAAVNPRRTAFWTGGQTALASPLARYLDQSCATTETIGTWQVRRCDGRITP
jgi:hypothetical protein